MSRVEMIRRRDLQLRVASIALCIVLSCFVTNLAIFGWRLYLRSHPKEIRLLSVNNDTLEISSSTNLPADTWVAVGFFKETRFRVFNSRGDTCDFSYTNGNYRNASGQTLEEWSAK